MNAENVESITPLAPQQQGIFLESRASAGSSVHIEQAVHALDGAVDPVVLQHAWQHVIAQHPMLRTAFVMKGQDQPLQVVLRTVTASILEEDWRDLSRDAQPQRLEEFLVADRHCGFEFNRPPLVRLALFRTRDSGYEFVCTFHHILVDGWSIPIINRDLATYYAAIRKGLTVPAGFTLPYRDY